jgi:hypothetical protein
MISYVYPNNLKSWELGKEAPQNFCPERVTIALGQGTSEDENFEVKPTPPKTNSSSCLGIYSPSSSSQGGSPSTPEKRIIASINSLLRTPPSPQKKNVPSTQMYYQEKTTFCYLRLFNRCTRKVCNYAHSESELWPVLVPSNYKTTFCEQESLQGMCSYNLNCNHIHRTDWIERRDSENLVIMRIASPFFPHQLIIYKIGKISK